MPSSPAPAPEDVAEDQGRLELGTPAEDLTPLFEHDDFIRTLSFSETADNEAGFTALR